MALYNIPFGFKIFALLTCISYLIQKNFILTIHQYNSNGVHACSKFSRSGFPFT